MSKKKKDKTRTKKGKKQRAIKNQIEKEEKGNKMISQKSEKGQGKNLTKRQ
jgi:hypothetical protein